MKYFFTIFICLNSLVLFAQSPIKVEKNKIYQEGELLTFKTLVERMSEYPEAHELALKAKTNNSVGGVFGFIGGFMIGWPLGTAIGGGEPEWGILAAGVGVLGIGIPFASKANKQLNSAIDIYNSKLPEGRLKSSINLNLILKGTEFGLRLNF